MLNGHLLTAVLTIVFIIILTVMYRIIVKRGRTIELLRREKKSIISQEQLATEKLGDLEEKEQLLSKALDEKQKELINFALNIIQKNNFMEELKDMVKDAKGNTREEQTLKKLNKISFSISHHIALDKNRKLFRLQLEEANRDFFIRLQDQFPGLSEKEKRLSAYIRLNLSTKDVASLLNIAPKSVEINRYRLRKKLGIDSKTNLTEFILKI